MGTRTAMLLTLKDENFDEDGGRDRHGNIADGDGDGDGVLLD